MINPIHVRMARGALRWSLDDLSKRTGVSRNTLIRFEWGSGAYMSTAAKIEEVLTKEGITFLAADDTKGPGIVLSKELAQRLAEPRLEDTSSPSSRGRRRPDTGKV